MKHQKEELAVVKIPKSQLKHIRSMSVDMRNDLAFLEAGDDSSEYSVLNQRKYMQDLIDAIDKSTVEENK